MGPVRSNHWCGEKTAHRAKIRGIVRRKQGFPYAVEQPQRSREPPEVVHGVSRFSPDSMPPLVWRRSSLFARASRTNLSLVLVPVFPISRAGEGQRDIKRPQHLSVWGLIFPYSTLEISFCLFGKFVLPFFSRLPRAVPYFSSTTVTPASPSP